MNHKMTVDTWQIISHRVNEWVGSTWVGGTTHDSRNIFTLYGHRESLEEVACQSSLTRLSPHSKALDLDPIAPEVSILLLAGKGRPGLSGRTSLPSSPLLALQRTQHFGWHDPDEMGQDR